MKYQTSRTDSFNKNKDFRKNKNLGGGDFKAKGVLKNFDINISDQRCYLDSKKNNQKNEAQSSDSKNLHLYNGIPKNIYQQSIYSKQNDKALLQQSQSIRNKVQNKKMNKNATESQQSRQQKLQIIKKSKNSQQVEHNGQRLSDIDEYQVRSSKKRLRDKQLNEELRVNEGCESMLQENAGLSESQEYHNQANQYIQQQQEDCQYQLKLDNQFFGVTSQNHTIQQQEEPQTSREAFQVKNMRFPNRKSQSSFYIFKPRNSQQLQPLKSQISKKHLRNSTSNTINPTIQSNLQQQNYSNASKALDTKSKSEFDFANSCGKQINRKKISISELSKCHFVQKKMCQKSQSLSKNIQQEQNLLQVKEIPQSYILAMQQLQNKIEGLQEYVQQLHDQVLSQQKQKLQAEQKINQILKKLQNMSENYQNLEVQNRQLRIQVQSLRKSAAFKNKFYCQPQKQQGRPKHQIKVNQQQKDHIYEQSTQSQNILNKKSINDSSIQKSTKLQISRNSFIKNQKFDPQPVQQDESNKPNGNAEIQRQRTQSKWKSNDSSNIKKVKIHNNQFYPTFNSEKDFENSEAQNNKVSQKKQSTSMLQQKSNLRPLIAPQSEYYASASKLAFQSESASHSKFCSAQSVGYVSHYRQLIRYQKQLVALKYRQQCLERKLVSNKKNSGTVQQSQKLKHKLTKVTQQVNLMEKKITALKDHQNQGISTTMHLRV